MGCTMYGDWARAGVILKRLAVNLNPFAKGMLYEDGQLVLETIQGHIDKQDLNWIPLANSTVRAKGSDDIYVETGSLRNGLTVRKIKSSKDDLVLFVGASPWKRHAPSGKKMSEILIFLEYGTSRIPPRPLVEPTFEEVKSKIQKEWRGAIADFIGGK